MKLFNKNKKSSEGASDTGESFVTVRVLQGTPERIFFWLCVLTSLVHLSFNTFLLLPEIQRNAIHYSLFVGLAYMVYPLSKTHAKKTFAIDIALGIIAFCLGFYLVFFEEYLHLRNEEMILPDMIAAGLALIFLLEITRRSAGIVIPFLSLFFITYALYWGNFLTGTWNFPGTSLERVLYRMYFAPDGIFGNIATISSTFVFLFVLFGAFLVKSGAGNFILQMALSIFGHTTGGPAKMAIFASGLMGSVSGSAIANTVGTGSITIPMMKDTGFQPKFAAAVEAAASTGGQLMPPIMGAGAFIMAQWTQIPYLTIVALSFIPALMYFLTVAFFIHFKAKYVGLKPIPKEELPKVKEVFKDGWFFFIPIITLVGLMMYGKTPTFAASWSIVAIVVSTWFSKKYRMGPKDIVGALALGAKNMVGTAVVLLCSGVVVGIVLLVSLGAKFSFFVTTIAGTNLLLSILLIGIASLILGMGLPVTASYIIMAALSAPFLVNLLKLKYVMSTNPEMFTMFGLSVDMVKDPAMVQQIFNIAASQTPPEIAVGFLLASHLLIFWYSQCANVTPPVCLAAYTAAGIAHSKPLPTGVQAFKISLGLLIIPVLFIYQPAILFQGTLIQTVQSVASGLLGLMCVAVTMEGYFLKKLTKIHRIGFACIALTLFLPNLLFNAGAAAALAAMVTVIVLEKRVQAVRKA